MNDDQFDLEKAMLDMDMNENYFEELPISDATYKIFEDSVIKAKYFGADVSQIQEHLPQLKQKIYEMHIQNELRRIQERIKTGDITDSSFDRFTDEILKAKQAGVDASQIEAQLPELKKQVWEVFIKSEFASIQKMIQKATNSNVEHVQETFDGFQG